MIRKWSDLKVLKYLTTNRFVLWTSHSLVNTTLIDSWLRHCLDIFMVFLWPWESDRFSQNNLHTCYDNLYSIIIYKHLVFIFNIYILFVKYNNYPIYNVGFQVFYSSISLAIFGIFYNRRYDSSHFKIRGFKTVFIVSFVLKAHPIVLKVFAAFIPPNPSPY